jgi:hypothetical protein
MDETNGHAHENGDSGGLNERTKIERPTAKWSTCSAEEQHTIQKKALWRKRWKVCREGLRKERERRAESPGKLQSAERIPSQHQSYPDPRRLNLKWSVCMAAIMVLGGLAMLNSGKCTPIHRWSKTGRKERRYPTQERGWGGQLPTRHASGSDFQQRQTAVGTPTPCDLAGHRQGVPPTPPPGPQAPVNGYRTPPIRGQNPTRQDKNVTISLSPCAASNVAAATVSRYLRFLSVNMTPSSPPVRSKVAVREGRISKNSDAAG